MFWVVKFEPPKWLQRLLDSIITQLFPELLCFYKLHSDGIQLHAYLPILNVVYIINQWEKADSYRGYDSFFDSKNISLQ